MNFKTILVDRCDIGHTKEEEQLTFIFSILSLCGIPEEQLSEAIPSDEEFSVDNKIALRNICNKYQLTIFEQQDEVRIYLKQEEDQLIAIWYKPEIVYEIDLTAITYKKLFAKINFKWWSAFEEENG
jgi:hypothetical protein